MMLNAIFRCFPIPFPPWDSPWCACVAPCVDGLPQAALPPRSPGGDRRNTRSPWSIPGNDDRGGNMIEDYRLRMHVSYAVSLSTYDVYILVCGLCMLICEAHSLVCMRCYWGDATERSGHEVMKNHPEYQPWGLRNKFSQGYIWNCAVHRVKQ